MCSGYESDSIIELVEKIQADGILGKPIIRDDLIKTLNLENSI